MHIRRLKRKCSVRGCKCTDTVSISHTREPGNTVIICASCLKTAAAEVDNPMSAPIQRVSPAEAPPLFFNSTIRATEPVAELAKTDDLADAVADDLADDLADTSAEAVEELATEFKCEHCGQVCKTELGLQKHIAAKHKDAV